MCIPRHMPELPTLAEVPTRTKDMLEVSREYGTYCVGMKLGVVLFRCPLLARSKKGRDPRTEHLLGAVNELDLSYCTGETILTSCI